MIKKSDDTKHERCKLKYCMIILLRLCIILSSTSFIHPDEHFQNTEIAIQDVFNSIQTDVKLDRSWEWDPTRLSNHPIVGGPVRSIIPIWLTSHLSLYLLKLIHPFGFISISTRSLFIIPRLALFLLSFLVDLSIFKLIRSTNDRLIYGSSLYSLLFACRTFSNSLEAILFTLIFNLSLSIFHHDSSRIRRNKSNGSMTTLIIIWSFLNVFTVWVRVSYLCFALPIVLTISYIKLLRSLKLFLIATFSGLMSLIIFISIDSIYFNRWPTITPISLLFYNLNRQNLSEHGTHPYLLHLFINGPIIFGPYLWFTSWYQIFNRIKSKILSPIAVRLSIACVISGTLLLSIQPHQEPRFLLPLALPLTILSSQFKRSRRISNGWNQLFWIGHLLHSLITIILFGYLHQGGFRSVLEILPNVESKKLVVIMSYKTFDLPSSLIKTIRKEGQDQRGIERRIENFRGSMTEDKLIERLCQCIINHNDNDANLSNNTINYRSSLGYHHHRSNFLIAPRWSITSELESHLKLIFSSKFPHLDLDRLPSIWKAPIYKSSLGLYEITPNQFSNLC